MLSILTLLISLLSASAPAPQALPVGGPPTVTPAVSEEDDATLFLSEDDGRNWCHLGEGLPAKTRPRIVIEHAETIYMTTFQDVWMLSPGTDKWERRSAKLTNMDGITSIATDGDLLIIGTLFEGVYTSRNGGKSWSHPLFNIAEGGYIRSLFFHGGVLYAGSDVGVYRSFDGATTWSHTKELEMINVIAEHGGEIYVARQNGVGIYRDGDIEWTDLTTGWAIGQLYSHGDYLYATSAKQEIFRTRDGTTWETPDTAAADAGGSHAEVPAALWSGYLPQLPDEWPLGYLIGTSRGWGGYGSGWVLGKWDLDVYKPRFIYRCLRTFRF